MRKAIASIMIVLFLLGGISAAHAIGLGDILKVGGIAILVDRFAGPLNDFINKITFKHGISSEYATKVVPIISLGSRSHVGAAQVTGPQNLVDETEAVFQIEGDFSGQFRVKALIPVDSKNPTNFNRVNGVGVSAIIDVRI